ncbi:hypothetical protein C6Y62_02370 [Hyphomicrobium sulfonivorans]|nr:hypothetical protein [Hyphomicrobium sulfonivorans]
MKAGISTLAVLALMAAPAFAQDAPSQTTEPSGTQTDRMAPPPSTTPSASDRGATTTPSTTSPSMGSQAAAPASGMREAENDDMIVPQLNASVDDVEDMDIYDSTGRKIAEVEAVVIDGTGTVRGLVIEHGGLLGIGSREAILEIGDVQLKDGRLVVNMTEEQLPSLPEWRK